MQKALPGGTFFTIMYDDAWAIHIHDTLACGLRITMYAEGLALCLLEDTQDVMRVCHKYKEGLPNSLPRLTVACDTICKGRYI